MSVGAFTGTIGGGVAAGRYCERYRCVSLIAMVVGAVFAAIIGFLIGIPVLRLRGDYLAIVTLAFGEIIKSIFNEPLYRP